ncbi:SPOR domain-containing protein [Aliiroseovarius sp. YM-037]|uniref:SPOR domain-containing protein n=1 Tax=Aliiroseovarius sp. YM-037 TaxID=3341728 RepID=UPI003A811758
MARTKLGQLLALSGLVVALAGCEDGGGFNFLRNNQDASADGAPAARSATTVERDVEAPDVFQVSEDGLWDGRPSLGGVWVAYPDVADPERVMIRNSSTGKSVVGALFRRERETPGPSLQVSSDAAEALGMLAGQPASLSVVALHKEEVPEVVETEAATTALGAPEQIDQTTIDPIEAASAAIDGGGETAEAATAAPAAAPAQPTSSSLSKPFIQIGIFSVEENAEGTATSLRAAGLVPTVSEGSSNGNAFWRVVVGPAQSESDREVLLAKVKNLGFEDAYFVTN